jgi:hypothetical protein
MTTAQRIKSILIDHLRNHLPDESISVVDANQRTLATLPAMAVAVPTTEPHSAALWNVERTQIEITLRIHIGDEDEEYDLESWIDQIESTLNDPSAMTDLTILQRLIIHDWQYKGSNQEYSDATLDTTFRAECLASKMPEPG